MTRVLVILGGLNRGGAETWMIQVAKRLRNTDIRFDFLVHADGPFDYQADAESVGARVIPCKGLHFPPLYAWNLMSILKRYGPYQVVHSHVHYFSGVPLLVGAIVGVPVRMVQCHLDTRHEDAQANSFRRVYTGLMKRLIWHSATVGTAVSNNAASALFPPDWSQRTKWRIMLLGIDTEPFESPISAESLRRELGIPPDVLVVGHVGRFEAQKNHSFLLQVAAEYLKLTPTAVFLLVGDGPLRADIESEVRLLGIGENVKCVGVRKDVPALMRGVMDLFVLPSLFEGLPLVLLETQAAGLPCLLSDNIAEDSDLAPGLIHRLPLTASAVAWAYRLASLEPQSRRESRGCLELVGIDRSVKELIESYSVQAASFEYAAHSE